MGKRAELDPMEKAIEANIEKYVSVTGTRRRRIEAALEAARKTRNINIRISELDLVGLKRTAQEEGVPYQTLISSVLQKYLSGRLIDEKHVRKSVEMLSGRKVSLESR
jgi:predicted DNA binding CopG/RHH family protein